MSDELRRLGRSLESSVDPPPFESLAQRAEAVSRRRRARRAALATSLAVAAIVFAAMQVPSLKGGEGSEYAGSPSRESGPSTAMPSGEPEQDDERTYGYQSRKREPIRVIIPTRLFGDALRRKAAVELHGETTDGSKRVEYFAIANPTGPGRWKSAYDSETMAPQCKGLELRQTDSNMVLELPRRCLPGAGGTSRWTALGPNLPGGAVKSDEFVVTPQP